MLFLYEIVLPPMKILKANSEIVTPLFDQRELLQRKNNCLRKTRDLLLPKLISGQLDVEDIDIGEATVAYGSEQAATGTEPEA